MSATSTNRTNLSFPFLFLFIIFIKSQIPEEEKNLGPNDRLIHVYHFTKETAQNQMVFNMNELINIVDLFWLFKIYGGKLLSIYHSLDVLGIYILFFLFYFLTANTKFW